MKKQLLYTLGLGVLLTGCTGDYTDWANPQSNAEEDAKTVTLAVASVAAIDLTTVTTDSVQLFVPTVTSSETVTNTYSVVVANTDGTASGTITANANGYVETNELDSIVKTLYGRRPTARNLALTVTSYSHVNGISITNTGTTTGVVTPNSPEIDTQYYITGSINSWSTTDTTYPVVNGGGDVYEDPVFTCTLPASVVGTGFEFKLRPVSGVGGNITAAADSTAGKLANQNAGGNLSVTAVSGASYYKLSFNLYEQTWTCEALSYGEFLYMAGSANGWSQVDILRSPNYDGVYTGYMYLDQNGFKFCTQPNWSGTNYGANFSTDPNAANITMTESAGFYKVVVDLTASTYTLTAINTIGIIGSATANGWDSDQDMTYNTTDRCWEATGVVLTAGEIKFRANDAWAISWGGTSLNALTTDGGANISVTAGTYDIKLYPSYDGNTKATLTAQ